MEQKIVISNDVTMLYTAYCDVSHVVPIPCMEMPANIEYVPSVNGGLLPITNHHKLAQSVLHRNHAVAKFYHDCGRLIAHIGPFDATIGPAMSGRYIMFSAMDVLVENEPIGFGTILNWPPTPMLSCGLVPLPVGEAITSMTNGVIVGMDLIWDYLASWEGMFVEMVFGTIVSVVAILVTIATGPFALWVGLFGSGVMVGVAEGARFQSPGQACVESRRAQRGQIPPPPSEWDLL
jgi:hypothetical protein